MRYKVTGFRYETVEVEADSEDEAISKAFSELKSAFACSGYIDDYEVEEMEETEDECPSGRRGDDDALLRGLSGGLHGGAA